VKGGKRLDKNNHIHYVINQEDLGIDMKRTYFVKENDHEKNN